MSFVTRAARICMSACFLFFTAASVTHSRNSRLGDATESAIPAMLQQMAGTWDVRQRMWTGPGAEAINLPAALARRRLVEGAYLEEIMELAQKSEKGSFTRTAYFNYNAVSQQYEYFSVDSRAPQQMNYQSEKRKTDAPGPVRLMGGIFVAAKWGDATKAAFRYRLTIGAIEKDRQVVQLHLTPASGASADEFLAFEYEYTRRN